MLVDIAIGLMLLLAAILGYALMRPDTFRIQRTTRIAAPPERIYPLIVDFRRWPAWSPYEKLDPASRRTLSGADRGKGAVYAWEGNRNIGQGRMEIMDVQPPSRIMIKLDFMKPFEAHNIVDFTLEAKGDGGTDVTWAMHGPSPFVAKLMGLFFGMDKMVGRQFSEGLAKLRAEAEKSPAVST